MRITFEIAPSARAGPSAQPDATRVEAYAETARKEIDGFRAEINVRVQQRDNAIMGYLAAAAVVAAAAVKSPQSLEMLLIVPILSPAVAAIVAQHHVVIGRREALIKNQLRPLLERIGSAATYSEHGRDRMDQRELWTRTLAHVVSLFVPAVAALVLNVGVWGAQTSGLSVAWDAALVGTVVAGYFVVDSYRIRKGLLQPAPC